MITRRRAMTAVATLPLVTLLPPVEAEAVSPASFAERVVALVAPATQEELMAALYLLTDLAFMRGDLGIPRSWTTQEALASGQLDTESLRLLATDREEHELMEALIAAA